MAYHKKHHRKHHHRRNPLGITGGLVKEAAAVAAGAVGAGYLPGLIGMGGQAGWGGVGVSGLASIGMFYGARVLGLHGIAPDLLKGGLVATIFKALRAGGVSVPGLGLYAPSWFGIPTASSQYLQAANGNQPGFNRGGGTIIFPGPAGMVAAPPAHGRLGYHRFRSRYAGGYG